MLEPETKHNKEEPTMRHSTFNAENPNHVVKYRADGPTESGKLLLGEDGIVRFFVHAEISDMEGVGTYSGASGYCEYVQAEPARPRVHPEGLRALPPDQS